MKKISLLALLLIIIISSSVEALSWAYTFVVWEGKVYEVKQEETITDSQIGEIIGEVKTKPNDMTGDFYGEASNYYPKGTKYYEIKGISTSTAIAVEEDSQWVKAVYVHKAPFHIMNIFSNNFFMFTVVVIIFAVIGVIISTKKV
ncbi:hypothetical protein RG959_22260 [Domibacillus sp. 8LH]|uniref:hypothetical protein n=1 Tax=Domibacillus sp. 8LH TaxID=3073900 RepID=UPI003177EC45